MIRSPKTSRKFRSFTQRTFRGLSLIEAMLALGIGGIVIVQSFYGLSKYTSGVQVQATASKMAILNRAADRFAEDNYSTLLANAPQELPISSLAPYAGNNIGGDAYGNTYKLSTRTYNITVPDPVNGGTKTESALQVLIVAENADAAASKLTTNLQLRADIANAAGAAAGFIAHDELTCSNGAGGTRNNGGICGAFGSYSFRPTAFPATDFSNAALVSLVTKGDSSVYGDQLYRYDYGDPELNSMHTAIHMNNNDLDDVGNITRVTSIDLDGGAGTSNPAIIQSTDGKQLRLEGDASALLQARNGDIRLNASTSTIVLQANTAGTGTCPPTAPCTDPFPIIRSSNGLLRLNNSQTVFGDRVVIQHGGNLRRVGSGNTWAATSRMATAEVGAINSLFIRYDDALRLQRDRAFGEVVVGRRVTYTPTGSPGAPGAAGVYEISDGDITAQHVQVQDITCADCGGSLAAILPKWRHMGTYFIPQGTQSLVPKPQCTDTRRRTKNRGAIGTNLAYNDSANDFRYEAKIIVLPRQMATADGGGTNIGSMGWHFRATDAGANWITETDTQNAMASALAKTYCVFVGGDPNPAAGHPDIPTSNGAAASYPGFNIIE